MPKSSQRWWSWAALAAIVVIVFAVKLAVLNKYPTPPSSDMGNHLSILNAFHGHDVTGYDLKYRYPPLYFLLVLDPLTKLFPVFSALKISASLISTIIAIPFFLLARKITGNNSVALFASALYAFTAHSDMMSWGSIPNFLGLFFMLWSAYYIVEAVKAGSVKSAVLAGLFLSLTVGTHHLTAPYYVIALILFVLLLMTFQRRKGLPSIKILFVVAIVGILLSLPYLPTYISIINNSTLFAKHNAEVISTINTNINTIATTLWAIFRSLIPIWILVAVLGFFGLQKNLDDKFILFFILSLSLAPFFLIFILGSPYRPLYFLYLPVHLWFSGFLLFLFSKLNKAFTDMKLFHAALLTIFLSVITSGLIVGSYIRLTTSVDYYHVMDNEVVEALEWLRNNTEPSVVTITNDLRLVWWIEGYALRKSYMPAQENINVYKDQWQETEIAGRIMAGSNVIDNGYIRVADSFPSSAYNPKIGANLGSWYQDLIYFNNTQLSLTSNIETINVNLTSNVATLTYGYSEDYVMINQTVEVANAPQVIITYNVTSIDSFTGNYEVNQTVDLCHGLGVAGYKLDNDAASLTLINDFGEIFNVEIDLLETNSESVIVKIVPKSAQYSSPFLLFTLISDSPNVYMKFLVSVEPKVLLRNEVLEYFNTYELLRTYGISYVFLNKEGPYRMDTYRFLSDSQHFETAFENSGVLILEIIGD